jgi:transposase-like protein
MTGPKIARYSDDIRLKALELLAQGKGVRAVAAELGIGERTVGTWRDTARQVPKPVVNRTPAPYVTGLLFPGGRGRNLE